MGLITRVHSFVSGEKPTQTQWNVDIDAIIELLTGQLDEANVDYTSADGIVTLKNAQTITGIKTFSATYDNPVIFGSLRLWYDSVSQCLRVKTSNPSSISDGNILMEG